MSCGSGALPTRRPSCGTRTGYWFRNRHEQMLVGTRGNVPAPAPGTQWPSVIRERKREHSRKPEKSYQLIEAYFPNVPKIELNCRGEPRPGWDGWGNEAADTADPLPAAAARCHPPGGTDSARPDLREETS